MKTVGIICECNPFHGGHEYLIQKARSSGADCVVAVMSGNFVQRGEAAAADAHLRARALLSCGVDAVLELPFPYACAPAEFFAMAGIEILSRVGVNEVWFGSECGNLELLERLAALTDMPDFQSAYARTVAQNCGTTEGYLKCISEFLGEDVALSSNDLLGIAYLRAIAKSQSSLRPVTVKRQGSAYSETSLNPEAVYPCATALRRKWKEAGIQSILGLLPEQAAKIYAEAADFADLSYAERLILGHFRLTSAERLESVAVLSGGLGARLKHAAAESSTLSEMLSLAATKKYPNARLLRGILFALTGVEEAHLRTPPVYSRLLAANRVGCEFLSGLRKNKDFSVVTRRIDLPGTDAAKQQNEIEERAESLYALCHAEPEPFVSRWQKKTVILTDSERIQ